MKKHKPIMNYIAAVAGLFVGFLLSTPTVASGAAAAGDKSGDPRFVYFIVALAALALVIIYALRKRDRNPKFMMLYCCVAAANCGYLLLSLASSLEVALFANRVSYFGCAFAILMMLLIVLDVCALKIPRFINMLFVLAACCAFLLAASGGWLRIYYTSVSLEIVNGVSRLIKCYGPLHVLYIVYVASFFVLMVAFIAYAKLTKRIGSAKYAFFLAVAVLGNIGVWGVEQLIDVEFEFLSISFIATELLLLLMSGVLRDCDDVKNSLLSESLQHGEDESKLPPNIEELFNEFSRRVATLTPTERMLLQYYIDGCSLEEVADKAYISINTAKKHNTNLNRKLELRSREELSLYIELFRRADRLDEIAYIR